MILVIAMLVLIVGLNGMILFLILKCMAKIQEEEGVRRGRTTWEYVKELNIRKK